MFHSSRGLAFFSWAESIGINDLNVGALYDHLREPAWDLVKTVLGQVLQVGVSQVQVGQLAHSSFSTRTLNDACCFCWDWPRIAVAWTLPDRPCRPDCVTSWNTRKPRRYRCWNRDHWSWTYRWASSRTSRCWSHYCFKLAMSFLAKTRRVKGMRTMEISCLYARIISLGSIESLWNSQTSEQVTLNRSTGLLELNKKIRFRSIWFS